MLLPLTFLEKSRVALLGQSVFHSLLQHAFIFSFFLPSYLKGRIVLDSSCSNAPLTGNPCPELPLGFQHPQHNILLDPSLFSYYSPHCYPCHGVFRHLQPQLWIWWSQVSEWLISLEYVMFHSLVFSSCFPSMWSMFSPTVFLENIYTILKELPPWSLVKSIISLFCGLLGLLLWVKAPVILYCMHLLMSLLPPLIP